MRTPDPTTRRIRVIDSHTGGEPTRVVAAGGPPLGDGPLGERLQLFQRKYDHFRAAIVNEPRGSDALVGALLCKPVNPACAAGVIFFNNVGFLQMCGHGTIGLAVTLAHLGRIGPGVHRIETPVGIVEAELHDDGQVTVHNLPSYRSVAGLEVDVPGFGIVAGDVAWGGNWFFLTSESPVELHPANLEALTDYAWKVRQAVNAAAHPEVDHVEICGKPSANGAQSRNFVLCPGKAYDRSPCGTGTSAKLACLYADGQLRAGEVWRQESLTGSTFDGWVTIRNGEIYPHLRGSAFVVGEAELILDPLDPFCWGIPNR